MYIYVYTFYFIFLNTCPGSMFASCFFSSVGVAYSKSYTYIYSNNNENDFTTAAVRVVYRVSPIFHGPDAACRLTFPCHNFLGHSYSRNSETTFSRIMSL